jgi:hypothetical protein
MFQIKILEFIKYKILFFQREDIAFFASVKQVKPNKDVFSHCQLLLSATLILKLRKRARRTRIS